MKKEIKKSSPLPVMKFTIPQEILFISEKLKEKKFDAYLVGGCVRDLFLGRKPKDWDITTNAIPPEIMRIFPDSFYENEYGTVGIKNENSEDTLKVVEITPYRIEANYSDNRRPDSVSWGNSLEEDLKRRDFTINAIALNVLKNKGGKESDVEITDLFGGIMDLKERVVKAVGNPIERFQEDGLRIIRAVRIASELDFDIEKTTQQAIATASFVIEKIAKERIREEFVKMLMSDNPVKGIELLHKLNILKKIIPDLEKGIGVTQNQAHSYDVWEHSLKALAHGAKKNFSLKVRLATLFHDIGKPPTRLWSKEKNDWTFHGHDMVGAKITARIMSELKFSKEEIENVVKLVRWHMFFSDTELITLSAVRRMVARVGEENIWELMDVRSCDRIGTGRPKESPYRLRKYHSMIEEVLRDPISVATLKIGGNEIMNATKINPGPKIGFILNILLEETIENPELNKTEILINRAVELSKLNEKELEKMGRDAKDKKTAKEEKEIENIRKKYWVK